MVSTRVVQTESGRKRAPEYYIWASMKQRCSNPRAKGYADYGGRGISVCDRWQNFDNFLADMGPRPEGLVLDRIDVNGNYEPGNCRWATWEQQGRNKRRTIRRLGLEGLPVDEIVAALDAAETNYLGVFPGYSESERVILSAFSPGRIVPRTHLMQIMYGSADMIKYRAFMVRMSHLRTKLFAEGMLLRCQKRKGYWIEPAAEQEAA